MVDLALQPPPSPLATAFSPPPPCSRCLRAVAVCPSPPTRDVGRLWTTYCGLTHTQRRRLPAPPPTPRRVPSPPTRDVGRLWTPLLAVASNNRVPLPSNEGCGPLSLPPSARHAPLPSNEGWDTSSARNERRAAQRMTGSTAVDEQRNHDGRRARAGVRERRRMHARWRTGGREMRVGTGPPRACSRQAMPPASTMAGECDGRDNGRHERRRPLRRAWWTTTRATHDQSARTAASQDGGRPASTTASVHKGRLASSTDGRPARTAASEHRGPLASTTNGRPAHRMASKPYERAASMNGGQRAPQTGSEHERRPASTADG
ncbi:hypothetical protein BJ912DRAFT_934578 [Pholiota molesta]|nr:hypothetical protein BJ912DRAFT_934578 [Pholiota molesta]